MLAPKSLPILIFLCESAQKMHYFTQNTSTIFWGWGTAPYPDSTLAGERYTQTLPLGTYGTSTPRLRCGLDAFGSWSRYLGGLTPTTVKILATSLNVINGLTLNS